MKNGGVAKWSDIEAFVLSATFLPFASFLLSATFLPFASFLLSALSAGCFTELFVACPRGTIRIADVA